MKKILLSITLFIITLNFFSFPAQASHSWGTYHWARTSNPFTLKLGDNLTSNWDPYLSTTSLDWSQSNVLDTSIVVGSSSPKRCQPKSGRVEVCNSRYGSNGWLGVAQIWASGNHITQAVTKLNDTYFSTAKYNTPEWKNLVMCQEVGHVFGLDHQDEDFANANLGTCMDYTNSPASNQHPNVHDYEQLESIYSHLDGFTTIQSSIQNLPLGQSISNDIKENAFDNKTEWGDKIKDNGHVALFKRNIGNGKNLFTFTIWAK